MTKKEKQVLQAKEIEMWNNYQKAAQAFNISKNSKDTDKLIEAKCKWEGITEAMIPLKVPKDCTKVYEILMCHDTKLLTLKECLEGKR